MWEHWPHSSQVIVTTPNGVIWEEGRNRTVSVAPELDMGSPFNMTAEVECTWNSTDITLADICMAERALQGEVHKCVTSPCNL